MAFTGVNRATVAGTDTFDTWRIRTNEINTSLNQATASATADKLVWRDDVGSANLNILNANTLRSLFKECSRHYSFIFRYTHKHEVLQLLQVF